MIRIMQPESIPYISCHWCL